MPSKFETAIARIAPVATRPFTLHGVLVNSKEPVVLHCRHAGFSNPELSSASLKSSKEYVEIAKIDDDYERLKAEAARDAKLFRHTVVSWDNCNEDDGKPASIDQAGDLLCVIAERHLDLFLRFKSWVNNAANFADTPIADPGDLGK